MTPIPLGGRLVRGVRRPIKPYAGKAPGRGIIVGFDTETVQADGRAKLYTVQLHTAGHRTVVERCRDSGEAWRLITRTLGEWGHLRDDGPVVLFAYNLNFDLLWLFGSSAANRRILAGGTNERGKHLRIDADGAGLTVRQFVYGRVAFADIDHDGYRFNLRDLGMWWPGGLAQAGELLGRRKLPPPPGLGRLDLLRTPQRDAFLRYARRDAVVAYELGALVVATLRRLKVWSFKHVPVSAAHASSLLFRAGLPEPIPPARTYPQLRAALSAFAGGRSGTVYRGNLWAPVTAYDVNSMYPWAMMQLPEPAGWNTTVVNRWAGEHAIYLVDGRCDDATYPGLVERDRYGRMWPLVGEFRGVWTTGYELASFRRHGDGDFTIRHGFAYSSTRRRVSFPRFVRKLYALRANSEPPAVRALAKYMLNSLSGKFIEHHSRFALPKGLRFRVAAPATGDGLTSVHDGRRVVDPNTGAPHPVYGEQVDGAAARDFDEYIGGLISALMEGDYQEVKRRSKAAYDAGHVQEVNLEYMQQDAGGTFAPELATLILGRARARLHDLMHETNAVYWDTDSVMTFDPIDPAMIGDGIGQLKVEAAGWLTVARPKMYYLAETPGGRTVKIANAGVPDRVPEADRRALIGGSAISYADVRGVSPRTTRDPQFRDVGTFLDVRVDVAPLDDPRIEWEAAGLGDDVQRAHLLPMPYSVRGAGRLRDVEGDDA